MTKHQLYTDADRNAPDSIKDGNGQVVLGLCKVCGKGEVDLEAPCDPRPPTARLAGKDLPLLWNDPSDGDPDIYVGVEIPTEYLLRLQPGSCWWGHGLTVKDALARLTKEVERYMIDVNAVLSPERVTLIGNAFITIPKGTLVTTDDPKFPTCILQEDVKVCSNAKAEVIVVLPRKT